MELKCTLILFGSFLLCSESRECDEGFMKINKTFVFCHNEDEDECATPNLCGDNTRCINTHGSYYCTCDEGFFLVSPSFTSDTGQCVDEDECLSSVCGVHSDCTNTPGSFFCTCYPGFDKLENGTCADINECADPDVCGKNADCLNYPGRYSCRCHQGYSNYGNDQSKCKEMMQFCH
ncbi:adhesion G protein-coupled receptor E2-like [Megalobrama amblycephala]|uniref:adhesion G protein-coupled receptor E2-like n=1 Tax=Megalobrama amblycephala TaxID=75352 RepID=UPI002013CEAB|nr:adhesion G protein-coupled receptor E2-like [Megalobrama amblycephala]